MPNLTMEERGELLKPITEKYFSKEGAEALKQRKYDQRAVTAQWELLLEEAKSFLAANADPASAPVQNLAQRWEALIQQFTGGDETLRQNIRAVWKEAMSDPKTAPAVPWTPELWAYVAKFLGHLKSAK